MPVEVLIPKLGLTMQEGKVVRWRKKVGEYVEKGEILYELETEKILYEVESPGSGVLGKIIVFEEEIAPVGSVVAYILLDGEDVSSIPVAAEIKLETASGLGEVLAAEVTGGGGGERVKISPVAKKMAEEKGISINTIRGTGPGGRIVKEDVLLAIQEMEANLSKPDQKEYSHEQGAEIIKLSSMRQIIARRMSESFHTAPHIYLTIEVDAGELLRLREDLLAYVEKDTKFRLSVTDLLVKILAKAIREYPLINATWSDEGIKINSGVNIGIATSLDDGLLVPVIYEADKKTLPEITSLRADLTKKARERKLSPDDLKGGTFTLSNLGMYEIDFFQAIINPPESVILAVGAIKEKPVAQKGSIVIRPMMCLTLSADHRIVDGAYGAKALQRIKEMIEKPILAFQ